MRAYVYKRSLRVKGFGGKLAKSLGMGVIGPESKTIPSGAVVFNYGRASLAPWHSPSVKYINHPTAVARAGNKLLCLQLLADAGVPCLKYTTLKKQAEQLAVKNRVFCRTVLNGHSGDGIEIAVSPEQIVAAPLYTLEYPKTHEYRVHVFNGKIIDKVQKKSMSKEKLQEFGLEAPERIVRNYKRGWVFAHHDLVWDDKIGAAAVQAVQALGLNYGAVDMLARWSKYSPTMQDCVVCEVNTAPGLRAPTTFDAYRNAIAEIICQ